MWAVKIFIIYFTIQFASSPQTSLIVHGVLDWDDGPTPLLNWLCDTFPGLGSGQVSFILSYDHETMCTVEHSKPRVVTLLTSLWTCEKLTSSHSSLTSFQASNPTLRDCRIVLLGLTSRKTEHIRWASLLRYLFLAIRNIYLPYCKRVIKHFVIFLRRFKIGQTWAETYRSNNKVGAVQFSPRMTVIMPSSSHSLDKHRWTARAEGFSFWIFEFHPAPSLIASRFVISFKVF